MRSTDALKLGDSVKAFAPDHKVCFMNGHWPIKTINECAAPEPYSTQIGPFGKALTPEDYTPTGVPLLRGVNVNSGRFHDDSFVFVSEETANRFEKFESFPGDVLLVHKGTLGKIGLMPAKRRFPRYIMGNSMLRVNCNRNILLPEYLYYWLSSDAGQHYLFSRISQVGVPQLQTPLATLRQAALPVPPTAVQRSITDTLGALDDKIDLNRRMNETLESIARAMFRSWFVDFDPVRAKLEGRQPAGMDAETAALFPDELEESPIGYAPSGWAVASMQDHVEVVKGLSYKGSGLAEEGLPLHNLNSIFEGGGYKHAGIKHYSGEYKERHTVRPGDLIVANTEQGFDYLLIGYPAIVPRRYGKFGLFTHHTYRVRPLPRSPLTPRYLYFALLEPRLREEVVGCTNGTTVNMLAVDGLKRPRLLIPPEPIIRLFDSIVSSILDKIEANEEQSRTLAAFRDALLPKLLSGEIRVKDAEQLIGSGSPP